MTRFTQDVDKYIPDLKNYLKYHRSKSPKMVKYYVNMNPDQYPELSSLLHHYKHLEGIRGGGYTSMIINSLIRKIEDNRS